MQNKSVEDILKMSPTELYDYNVEKTISIFNLIIANCQKLKEIIKKSPKLSNDIFTVMSVARVFNNLLSDENIETGLSKIQNEIEEIKEKLKTKVH